MAGCRDHKTYKKQNTLLPRRPSAKQRPRQQQGSHGLRTSADGEPVPARRGLRHDGPTDLDPPLHDAPGHDTRLIAGARRRLGERGPDEADRRRPGHSRAAEGVEGPARRPRRRNLKIGQRDGAESEQRDEQWPTPGAAIGRSPRAGSFGPCLGLGVL